MKKTAKILLISIIVSLCVGVGFALAATGTISATNKYAWSNKMGWINFAPTGSGSTYEGLTITDTAVTGYAWSQNYGWINFSPSNGGVSNTTAGTLSGYAWGEKVGWLSFSGTSIGCSGRFTGTASGYPTTAIAGTISFSCANCNVTTTWLPSSGCSGGGGGSGGGSGGGNDVAFHNTCSNEQCVSVAGAGTNTCSTNSDCITTHNECSNQQCVSVAGNGVNQCSVNSECVQQTHNECSNQQCVSVAGAGSNQCQVNSDCNITHNVCSNQQCVSVAGVGIDQCSANADCATPVHNVCSNQQCTSVAGAGPNTCQVNADCITSHSECSNFACVSVNGVGINQCQSNSDCAQPMHNVCSNNACVSVAGAGSNSCQTDADCTVPVPVIPPPPQTPPTDQTPGNIDTMVNNITDTVKSVIGDTAVKSLEKASEAISVVTQNAVEVAGQVKDIVVTPQGAIVTKTVSTVGAVVGGATVVSAIVFSPASLFEIFLIPLRLFALAMMGLGIRRRTVPWGVAYDSVTKQPLDPALITLRDFSGKEIATAITDINGRYGFLVPPGFYLISAQKSNYGFPSKKMMGRTYDEIYNNLYFGEMIEIKTAGEAITKNIPLDPLKFDWNEFAKKDQGFVKFYSKWDMALRGVSDIFFVVGFVIAIIAFFAAPYPYNSIIMGAYLLMLLLRVLGLNAKTYGSVRDKASHGPLSFAILRIMSPANNIEISHKITDAYGRYYCLVPKGKYYVKIEKKNEDGSYSLVHTSPVIDVSRTGIIKERFEL